MPTTMANEKEKMKLSEEEEPKIPVFTVLKSGAILKNIFIVNKAPPPPRSNPIISTVHQQTQEEILIVGRHPDCNIVLTHPSISRFHLQILSNPSSQNLSLTDLSSVHGTWVSEKKLEPGVRVELREGDTLRVGGSSRVYRLHWIPLSRAYDLETPFVPFTNNHEDENAEEEEVDQGENSLPVENKEIEFPNSDSVGIGSLFSDEMLRLIGKKEIPSAPPMPENVIYSICDQSEEGGESFSKGTGEGNDFPSFWAFGTESMNLFFNREESSANPKENQCLQPRCRTEEVSKRQNAESSSFIEKQGEAYTIVIEENSNLLVNPNFEHFNEKEEEAYPAVEVPEKIDSQSPSRKDDGHTDVSCRLFGPLVMENLSLPTGEVLAETKGQQVEEDSQTLEPELNLNSEDFDENEEEAYPAAEVTEKIDNQSPLRKDDGQTDISCLFSGHLVMESLAFPIGEVLGETTDQQVAEESLTPEPKSNFPVNLNCAHSDKTECLVDERRSETENKRLFCTGVTRSIWARRGKPADVVQIQTDRSGEAGYDDATEIEQDEEIFTPDKENFTPNTLRLRSLKKKDKIEDKPSKSRISSSSKLTVISNIHQQDLIVSPEKENQKLEELEEKESVGTTSGNQDRVKKKLMATKVRRERMPLQSLLKNSGGKNSSEASVPDTTTRNSACFSCTRTTENVINPLPNKSVEEEKRGWTMVADTTTLLDKESRKSLQLLQGLKGTRLVIPRMVIRELDCLKQGGSLFRRKTQACLVLEWIEESMAKTKWWIHVQSSVEDRRLIAPTPRVCPESRFSGNSWGFPSGIASSLPFSRCRSLMDLESPAAEDHILDCALSHRMNNDEQLVLLSNDVILKIKAMGEGLRCETAEEFRESLVNPCSERFMWPDSSPCGRTWSYIPDVGLREKYNSYPLKKSSKGEGAKGLKLILLHNSHYGQIR